VREASDGDVPAVDVAALLEAITRSGSESPRAAEDRPGAGAANLVVLPGADVDYAVVVDVVRAITSPRDWAGAKPLDLAAIVRAPAAGVTGATPRERLVVVRAADREVALHVGGAVSFREVEAARLLPLPPMLGGRLSDLVERVAFFDDQRPLLLLNPAALAPPASVTELRESGSTASPPPGARPGWSSS
jgi:hypothetical protein